MQVQNIGKFTSVDLIRGKENGIDITTSETYPSLSVKQIFNNSQQTHGSVQKDVFLEGLAYLLSF